MNELDRLAREKFKGDMQKTAEYVITVLSPEEQDRVTDNMTAFQADEFAKYLSFAAREKGIDIEKIVADEYALASMKLSKEEVSKMEVNPFKANLGKDLLKFVVLNGSLAAVYLAASQISQGAADVAMNVGLSVTSILNTLISFETVKDMLNFFRFKKMKKKYSNSVDNTYGRGM